MKKFEGSTDALREVKKIASDMDIHDKIFLAYNEYDEVYYVTDDRNELSEAIHQRWCDSGCECTPEVEVEDYKIWEYSLAVNKEKYPNTYKSATKSLIRSENQLIRRTKEIECQRSVDFVIGY